MFTTADISLLTAITTHVAAALETARAAQLALAVQSARNERDVAERLRDARRHRSATGRPASARISATASMVNGVWAAGLTAMVQSAAIAGPIFRVPMARGTFHGVTSRHGPTGCFMVISRVAPLGAIDQLPDIRTASSANQRRNSAPYAASARDSASALPISKVISKASRPPVR